MEDNRTILIVDDEPETLKGYQDFLSPKDTTVVRKSTRKLYGTGVTEATPVEKYNLLLASTGEEAIKLVKNELQEGRCVAAGFFDVKLGGGMDGLATIHAIKALDPKLHCVVVTAYQDRSVEEINQIFGNDFKDQWDYLNKPFTQGEIIQKARQMVSSWNNKRHLEIKTKQLIRSEKLAAVGQVARGIGHEFGNILLRVMGKIELSIMEQDINKIKENLKVALNATERAGVIIRNLQSFSKTESQYQFESITVPLEQSISLISHELNKTGVKIEKKYSEVPKVKLDVGSLAQVFLNLLINAIHAMPEGGTITVRVEKTVNNSNTPGISVAIADTGTGIPDDVLPRIFEISFTTKGDSGSGIGLSISKDIVEMHGGILSVKTELKKGSEFTVWIPASKEG